MLAGEPLPLRRMPVLRPALEAFGIESRVLSSDPDWEAKMTNSGFELLLVILLLLVGWFVLMRFVLPRLGVST
jgi:p-aminobenzoyl-glutamate transporter AbgT